MLEALMHTVYSLQHVSVWRKKQHSHRSNCNLPVLTCISSSDYSPLWRACQSEALSPVIDGMNPGTQTDRGRRMNLLKQVKDG